MNLVGCLPSLFAGEVIAALTNNWYTTNYPSPPSSRPTIIKRMRWWASSGLGHGGSTEHVGHAVRPRAIDLRFDKRALTLNGNFVSAEAHYPFNGGQRHRIGHQNIIKSNAMKTVDAL